jgi:hypothetical protein
MRLGHSLRWRTRDLFDHHDDMRNLPAVAAHHKLTSTLVSMSPRRISYLVSAATVAIMGRI